MGGEDELIAAIRRTLGPAALGEGVELGIGDDAAVLAPPAGERLVATVDMLVEGQHFQRGGVAGSSLQDIGWRALAVNLSDVAAMGARPLWALVSLGVPDGFPAESLEELYAGLSAAARRFGVAVVGGNLARVAERLVVDLALLGAAGCPVTRAGGRPGDLVCVTGTLGAAAAGLALTRAAEAVAVAGADAAPLLLAQRRPEPRLLEGRTLAEFGSDGLRAMCDVSDGLTRDLERLGGVDLGAVLWRSRLPVRPEVRRVAEALGTDPLAWVLGGGEDYELLCLLAPEAVDAARRALALRGGAPLTVIGECVAEPGLRLATAPGERGLPLSPAGWDPFRR